MAAVTSASALTATSRIGGPATTKPRATVARPMPIRMSDRTTGKYAGPMRRAEPSW